MPGATQIHHFIDRLFIAFSIPICVLTIKRLIRTTVPRSRLLLRYIVSLRHCLLYLRSTGSSVSLDPEENRLNASEGTVRGLFVALPVGQLVSGPDLLRLADSEPVLVAFLDFFQRKTADFEVEEVDKDETELLLEQ
jgi:hypothetical protein